MTTEETGSTLPENESEQKEQATELTLTAYNVKTKQKGCPILDGVITKTAKGAFMCQGNDGQGNKLTTLLGKEKALAVIAAGMATQGWQD